MVTLKRRSQPPLMLIVGCPDDWGMFDYRTANGDFAGMDVEILRAIARRLQIHQMDFHPVKFRDLAPALKAGAIDVVEGGTVKPGCGPTSPTPPSG